MLVIVDTTENEGAPYISADGENVPTIEEAILFTTHGEAERFAAEIEGSGKWWEIKRVKKYNPKTHER